MLCADLRVCATKVQSVPSKLVHQIDKLVFRKALDVPPNYMHRFA